LLSTGRCLNLALLGTQVWFSDTGPRRSWLQAKAQLDQEAAPVQLDISPNDPLQWPAWRKDAVLIAVGFYSFLSAALNPILATGFPDIAEAFGATLQQISFTIGIYMLGLGVGALVWCPTATLYGRRPVYLAAALLLMASCAWAAVSPSYASLILSRLLQGLAATPGELLVSVTVSEIFLPQERGFRLGIYMSLIAAGKSLSPLIGAGVIQGLGWRWVMWYVWLLSCMILANARQARYDCVRDMFSLSCGLCSRDLLGAVYSHCKHLCPVPIPILTIAKQSPLLAPRHPGEVYTDDLRISPPLRFRQTMVISNGRLYGGSWLSLASRSFHLLKSPPLLFSAVVYALSLGWIAVLAETIAHLFQTVNGYGFTPVQTGLLYISPLIGTIVGSVVGGKISDLLACAKAYRNDGIYEPESRLIMLIPAAISTVVGLAGYGWSIEKLDHWIVPTICFGLIYLGCILGCTVAVTYCLDVHKTSAIEAQVVLSLFKSKLSYIGIYLCLLTLHRL
jgi:MFS family permease